MACNVGGIERPIRIVLGILLIGVGAFAGLPAGWNGNDIGCRNRRTGHRRHRVLPGVESVRHQYLSDESRERPSLSTQPHAPS